MKRLFPVLISILSLFLILNLSRELIRLSKAGERIEKAKEKVEQLKLKNWQLKKEKDYRETQEFLEKEIRDKLGMAKEGEAVVVLPQETIEKIASQAAVREEKEPLPVWRQWLELFW